MLGLPECLRQFSSVLAAASYDGFRLLPAPFLEMLGYCCRLVVSFSCFANAGVLMLANVNPTTNYD
jgi:hypothetical protein